MNNKKAYNEEIIKHSKRSSFKIKETNSGSKKQLTYKHCEINTMENPKKHEEDFEYEYEQLFQLLESLDDTGAKKDLGLNVSWAKKDLGYYSSDSDSEDTSLGHPNRRLQAERSVQQGNCKIKRNIMKRVNQTRKSTQLLKREKMNRSDLSNCLTHEEHKEDGQRRTLTQLKRRKIKFPSVKKSHVSDIVPQQNKSVVSNNELSNTNKNKKLDGDINIEPQIKRQKLQLLLPKERNISDIVPKQSKYVVCNNDLSSSHIEEKPKEDGQSSILILPEIKIQKPQSPSLGIRSTQETVKNQCAAIVEVPKDISSDKTINWQENSDAKQKFNSGKLWSSLTGNSSQNKVIDNIDVDYKMLLEDYVHCLHKTNRQSQTFYEIRFQEKLMNSTEEKVTASHFLKEFYIPPAQVEVFHQQLTDDMTGQACLHAVCEGRGWPQPVYKQDHCQDLRAGFVYLCQLKGVKFTSSKPASNHELAMELAALACLDWLGLRPTRASDKLNTYF